MTSTLAPVISLLSDIADVGRDRSRGGYSRPVYSTAELDLRSWYVEQAEQRGLETTTDRNGILWSWWDAPDGRREDAVVTGSHLDSVPGGGAFDGPLGVASALAAVDQLRGEGFTPSRPIALTVFPEEEGSRFGVACLGSRLLAGSIDPDRARALTDGKGSRFADVASANGLDPRGVGRDGQALGRIGRFIELHVEQGRGLIDHRRPIAVGSSILGHGRWRLSISGQGNHAGTTLMADRQDPMVAAARIIVAAQETARGQEGARATVGRVHPVPGGTNVIASRVDLWLDVRHPEDAVTATLVGSIVERAREAAAEEGCVVAVTEESLSATAHFDAALQRELGAVLPDAPVLSTGMLFVRNPTGISHSPEESIEGDDAEYGASALARVLADQAGASK